MKLPGALFSKIAEALQPKSVRRLTAVALLMVLTFAAGYTLGDKDPSPPSFHDMIINHADGLSLLVTPEDSRVKALAEALKTPQNAYLYLRDSIAFDPSLPVEQAGTIAEQKRASCLGKAVLLSSIYLAMGMTSNEVRVVTGEVEAGQGILDHAWVEIEHNGKCLQQDSTDLLGKFTYDQFNGMAYTNAFIKRENYAFNDKGFAVISRLNMMKGSGHPLITKSLQ
jgi:hypothetical protein